MGNLSIARKRALLDLVHASAASQSLYVQTIGGAVQLAGDQVQNKRTSLLEKGPEVKPSDLLFDTLLTLALGQIFGLLVSQATKAIFAGALRTRSALVMPQTIVPVEKLTADVISRARKLQIGGTFPIDQRGWQYKLYAKFTESALSIAASKAQAQLAAAGRPRTPAQPQDADDAGDTAGVAVADVVQNFVNLQQASINLAHNRLTDDLQMDAIDSSTADELEKLLHDNLSPLPKGVSLEELKDRYKRGFEAVIWSQILPLPVAITREHYPFNKRGQEALRAVHRLEQYKQEFGRFRIDSRLGDYLMKRLYHVQSAKRETILAYAKRTTPRNYHDDPRVEAMRELDAVLWKISERVRRHGLKVIVPATPKSLDARQK